MPKYRIPFDWRVHDNAHFALGPMGLDSAKRIQLACVGLRANDDRIGAIKLARYAFGITLSVAKEWVDNGCPEPPYKPREGDIVVFDSIGTQGTVLAVHDDYSWVSDGPRSYRTVHITSLKFIR